MTKTDRNHFAISARRRLIRMFFSAIAILELLSFQGNAASKDISSDQVTKDVLLSKYASNVQSRSPHPEYPRPQLVRTDWMNLNGLWDFAVAPAEKTSPPNVFSGKILVPFPVESPLSGVGQTVTKNERLWYARSFRLPGKWRNSRIILHFGAVDWQTIVRIDGKTVGTHQGGYSAFNCDITKFVQFEKDHVLTVEVWDPTDDGCQPLGRQSLLPGRGWHTPVSGIWQTVWLEPVPFSFIRSVRVEMNTDEKTIGLSVVGDHLNPGDHYSILVHEQGREIAAKTVSCNEPIRINLINPRYWSPDDPFLYDFSVSLKRGSEILDTVDSYFGYRKISVKKTVDGIPRLFLNNRFLFHVGVVETGMWPDGLYTAPTDEAVENDIQAIKQSGFNLIRKSGKIEPARYYYHCDRLGVMVWQEMPGGDKTIQPWMDDLERNDESKKQFETELNSMLEQHQAHPSIVAWILFNEAQGQFDSEKIVAKVKNSDPSRLVCLAGGWCDRGNGDLLDIHAFTDRGRLPVDEKRAVVRGAFGGFGRKVDRHVWPTSREYWWYGYIYSDERGLVHAFDETINHLWHEIPDGLSGIVYHQWTDVENELDGMMTYDRRVSKFEPSRTREVIARLSRPAPRLLDILPDARNGGAEWSYTFTKPSSPDWMQPDFKDSSWRIGRGGFGVKGMPGATVNTLWDTRELWLRCQFELGEEDIRDPNRFRLWTYQDDSATVYLNGVKILEEKWWTDHYKLHTPAPEMFGKALKVGTNTFAVHIMQETGGQYFDLGLSKTVTGKPD